ncbi:M28 family peptidase [Brevibacillus thermoruber]|uniref:M28 family peptidase n=1 Tax=Brevibacillus thermoruber TaxID=33942 RepID=A0A9X3Z1X1_9BACL|nr:M28 family peptidase [Brevibacillus thermoruber]MDA5107030.1 M28 family peptidase [Brevibacillus thermoruber]
MRAFCRWTLGAMLAISLNLPLPAGAAAGLQDQIDADSLYGHVERLSRLPRAAATESEFAAIVYVEEQLRLYGYETRLQPFAYYVYRQPTQLSLRTADWPERRWNVTALTHGPNGRAAGEIVDAGRGTAAELSRIQAEGKILLIRRGEIPLGEKVRNAAAAKAAGAILVNDADGAWSEPLEEPLDMAVPAVLLPRTEGELLRQRLLEKGKVSAELNVSGGVTSRRTSYNLIAARKPDGANTGQTVLVTARHDSLPASPGANEGASGVAVLLETARLLADQAVDTEVRFVSLGAAFDGEQGAAAYVRSLSEAEKQQIVAAFCLNGVGSADAGELTAVTADGQRNLPADLAARAGAVFSGTRLSEAGGEGEPIVFARAGIPAAALVAPVPADKQREHPQDTVDRISRERLSRAAQVVLAAVGEIAGSQTPAYPAGRPAARSGR